MSDFGHVKISRKAYADDSFWNEEREFSKWEAWEWTIQAAAWKDHSRVVGMSVVELRRGEFLASLRFLSEAWRWSIKRVRNWLVLVTEMGRIRAQRETHAGTVYLLVNYDTYQSTPTQEGTQKGTTGAQEGHDRGTVGAQSRSSKAVKAEELLMGIANANPPSVRELVKRAKQLPDGWTPSTSHRGLAGTLGLDADDEAERFRDFHTAKGSVMKDWEAAFRTWLRNANRFASRDGRSAERPSLDAGVWG